MYLHLNPKLSRAARSRFYFAWKIAEAANAAGGLGFSGWSPTGAAEWCASPTEMFGVRRI